MDVIPFFPTPYPDELWYSVLCRYHVRSGNPKYAATTKELFGTSATLMHTWLAPQGFGGLFERMPAFVMTPEDVIINHTLAPYMVRFSSVKKRRDIISYLLGTADHKIYAPTFIQWTPEHTFLRYCPLCADEDESQYGELYWHRTHQIQAMRCCPKHGSLLLNSNIACTQSLKQRFAPATRQSCPRKTPTPCSNKLLLVFSQTLESFLAAPFDPETDERPDVAKVLKTAWLDAGYLSVTSGYVDNKRLFEDLCNIYSKEFVRNFFVDEGNMRTTATRIINKAAFTLPEQYALLLAAAQITYPFAEKPTDFPNDKIAKMLRKIRDQRIVPPKHEVADILGIPVYTLDKVARERGIEPFWTRTSKGKKQKRKQHVIRLIISKEEKNAVKHRADDLQTSISSYLRYCIEKDMGCKLSEYRGVRL